MTPDAPRRRRDLDVAPWVWGAATAALVLAMAAVAIGVNNARYAEQERAGVLTRAAVVKTELELAVRERTVLADALAAFVRTDPDVDEDAFSRFAAELLSLQPDVRALQLAPDAVIRFVEPVESNRAAIGLDLRSYGPQRDVVLRTIESDRFVIGGPLPLVQGGQGMIARLAIDVDHDGDPVTPERFWGLAQVVIDLDAVLDSTSLASASDDLDLALRGVDGLGADGDLFLRTADEPLSDPVLLDVVLPGGSWQLAATPTGGWEAWAPGSSAIARRAVVLALLLGAIARAWARRPAELRRRIDEATRELLDSRERLAAVMNTARDAILEVDRDLVVLDGNPAAEALLGVDGERLRGLSVAEVVDDMPGTSGRLTTTVQSPDGQTFTAEVTVDWQPDRETATVVLRDVTAQAAASRELERYTRKLERLNDELTRVDAMKRDFIGMASHEVRTPITAIRGFSLTLANRWEDLGDDDRRRCIEAIHRQTERLWRLMDDLLVASSIESGRVAGEVASTNVATLVTRAVDEAAVPRSQILVSCPSDLEVPVARDTLGRVLTAFLSNAVKYGAAPYGIDVTSPDDRLRIVVSDAGDGVPGDFTDELFQPFSQASTGINRTAHGTGLGLAVARGLAESLGGHVWYEPGRERGAVFGVELPVAPVKERIPVG